MALHWCCALLLILRCYITKFNLSARTNHPPLQTSSLTLKQLENSLDSIIIRKSPQQQDNLKDKTGKLSGYLSNDTLKITACQDPEAVLNATTLPWEQPQVFFQGLQTQEDRILLPEWQYRFQRNCLPIRTKQFCQFYSSKFWIVKRKASWKSRSTKSTSEMLWQSSNIPLPDISSRCIFLSSNLAVSPRMLPVPIPSAILPTLFLSGISPVSFQTLSHSGLAQCLPKSSGRWILVNFAAAAEDVSRSSCLHTTLLKVTVITIQQNQHRRTSACKLVTPVQSHPPDKLSQSATLCIRMDKVYVCNSASADSAEGKMSRNR